MNAKTAMDLVKEAKSKIENLTPGQVKEELLHSETVLIDIREGDEVKTGKIPGSVHASRGMLEFYADPSLPYYNPVFEKNKRIILHCASGGRSALAVQTLKEMGFQNIAHLDGGIKAWKEAGYVIE